MKQQQFRMKMVTMLLVALLVLAMLSGIRTIPLSDSSGNLRSAILRLTGQEESLPSVSPGLEESPSPAPSSQADNSLGSLVSLSPSTEGTEAETSSPPSSVSPEVDPEGLSLLEAFSRYFPEASPEAASPSPGTPLPGSMITPDQKGYDDP